MRRPYKVRLRMVEYVWIDVDEAESKADAKRQALEYSIDGADWEPGTPTVVEVREARR